MKYENTDRHPKSSKFTKKRDVVIIHSSKVSEEAAPAPFLPASSQRLKELDWSDTVPARSHKSAPQCNAKKKHAAILN